MVSGPVLQAARATGQPARRVRAGLAAAAALTVALVAAPASAQSVGATRDLLRDRLSSTPLAADYEAFVLFGGEKGLSSASYRAGDDTISTRNLPMSYTFADIAPGARPFLELTLGTASISQVETFQFRTGRDTRVAYDLTTYSGIGGLGMEIDGAPGFRIRPMALIGYSRVEDDTDFSGPGARFADAATRGILFNADVDSLLYGGAVEVAYDAPFTDRIDLSLTGRYTRLWADVVDASDRAWDTTGVDAFDTVTMHTELEGPTGATLMGRELRWIGFVGGAALIGSNQASGLDFSAYGELGAGLRIVDRETFPYVEGGSIRGSVILGDDVVGWSIGATLDF